MSNEKETQVFDQSDLDNLMAEIQEAEADSSTAENARAADDSSPEAGDTTETVVIQAPSTSEDNEAAREDPEEAQDDGGDEAPEEKALAQKDLDGLIEELNKDADDQPEASASDSEKNKADALEVEDPPIDAGSSRKSVAPEADASSNPDDAETKTIDQSELETLIKELQEGVEAPEIEPSQESEAHAKGRDQASAANPMESLAAAAEAEMLDPADKPTPDAPSDHRPSEADSFQSPDSVSAKGIPADPSTSQGELSEPQADAAPAGSAQQASPVDHSQGETVTDQTPSETDVEPEQLAVEKIDDSKPAAPLPTPTKKSKRKLSAGLAIAAVIFAVASSSLFIKFRNHSTPDIVTKSAVPATAAPVVASETGQDLPVVAEEESLSAPVDRVARIEGRLEEARALREALLTKQAEVLALKQHYQDGIRLIQNEIQAELTKNRIKSFPRAVRNNRIKLGLQTIQRRMGYTVQLDQPLQWLRNASEELLFINRLITIDIRMLDTVSGIDLQALEQQIDEAIETFQPSVGRLALSLSGVELSPLKDIWDKMFQSTRSWTGQTRQIGAQPNGRNQAIWNEICQGNYQHRSDLTTLSPDAARCLAQAKETDLFLNSIENLSPEAAKNLFAWEGNWVCLNGLSQISSETARYLFSWNGNWISLNGLQELRAEAARYLVHWQGRQLELMGLQFKGQPQELHMLTFLAQWQQAGGRLYVPDEIEKQIAKLMD